MIATTAAAEQIKAPMRRSLFALFAASISLLMAARDSSTPASFDRWYLSAWERSLSSLSSFVLIILPFEHYK